MLIHFKNRERKTDNGHHLDSRDSKFVVIVAGEASADLHGSNLVKSMKRLKPGIVWWGIGGGKMAQAGVKILFSSSEMAVVGLTEVFFKLGMIYKASRKLKLILKNDRPDLLILIDYPDFNIHIARTAKRYQIPVLYYISPQVWAWRRGRIRKIARRINHMAVILPFEKELYRDRPVNVDYVGHPLLDVCPQEVDRKQVVLKLGVDQGHPVVGLLPGSRKEEIKNLLPVMVNAAGILRTRYPEIQCVLPLAPAIEPALVQPLINNSEVSIKVFQGDFYEVLSVCDVAMVSSGTATLETAVMGIPMVIVYKLSPISYWVAKMLIRVPHIGLVNLVGKEEVAPELVQGEMTADRLAHEVQTILEDEEIRANMIKKLKGIKESLGGEGASDRTARIALEMMK